MAVDKDLQTSLRAAKGGKLMQFAFFPKGLESQLVVGKRISTKDVAAKKKEIGSAAPTRGQLVGEDGTLVFYVAKEPPGTLKAQLLRRLKENAGLTIPIEIRVKGDVEDEAAEGEGTEGVETPQGTEGEGTPPEPPPPPPVVDKAPLLKRLNGLGPDIKAALKGPKATQVQALFTAVNGLLKNDDVEQGGKVLDELEALVKPSDVPPPPPPPPGQGKVPPPPPLPPAGKAEVLKRLNALTPHVKPALAGPDGTRVQTLLGAVKGFIGNDDHPQAAKVLDELEPLVKKGTVPPPPPTPDGKKPSPPQGEPNKSEGANVAFAKAKIQWNQAKDMVRKQLADLTKTILDEFNDPDSAKTVKKLDRVLAQFNEGLTDALDKLYVAEVADRPPLRDKVASIVTKYLKYINEDKIIAHVEANPFKKIVVQKALLLPLTKLQEHLAAAGRA